MKKILVLLFILVCSISNANTTKNVEAPERTILFIIDGMTPGLHQRINLPGFKNLMKDGVLYKEVYLPLPAHPDSSAVYPWTCSIPNPVLMSGTVFIGQKGIKQNLIQHSFTEHPTAFAVNAWPYAAISHGFTIYKDYSNGIFEKVFQDELSVEGAKKIIKKHNPEFIRIHCQGPGSAGHKSHREQNMPYTGNIWYPGSPYIKQNQKVDQLLADFVHWLKSENFWNNTILIVMGDHGQAKEGGHPPYEHNSYTTQMLIAGKNIKRGITYPYAEIIDVAPTISWLHRLSPPKFSDGRILKEIIEGYEKPNDIKTSMKDLNLALLKVHNVNNINSFFSIKNIGLWHKGEAGNNYHRFVKYIIRKSKNLDNE